MTHHWTENDVPDQSGRVAIVTGGNSGIGWHTARVLAQKGATVIIACRNMQKANTAADEIRAFNPSGKVEVMPLDLSDLDSVREFEALFRERYDRLDLLINNAGIMFTPQGKTKQGFEQQFGTNHLGHFALTGILLDKLNGTPGARIVTVSSGAHRMGNIDFDDLNSERDYSPYRAYGQSKLANLLFTYELQRRLIATGQSTLAVAAHPGSTRTNLTRHSNAFVKLLDRIISQKSDMGALPTLYAATEPNVQGGEYFGPSGAREMRGYPKKVESNEHSQNEELARRLWTVSENLTHVFYPLNDWKMLQDGKKIRHLDMDDGGSARI
ncbi:MAG: SDR family NAD(P)-dependent oxidoreductase [Methanomassiliicoccus sp.]|nr:SDR family NAD(P)-dependent oxidoreductase [Methanomassiliicoccus sp.]